MNNPALHALYVGWAMHHLIAINKAIDELDAFSNINLLDIIADLRDNRAELINTDEAYRDAAAKLMAGEEPPPYHGDYSDIEARAAAHTERAFLLHNDVVERLPESLRSVAPERLAEVLTDTLNDFEVMPSQLDTAGPKDPELAQRVFRRIAEKLTTHYAHRNSGGAIFVKEANFFIDQGGLIETWGKEWRPISADDDKHAYLVAEEFFQLSERMSDEPRADRISVEPTEPDLWRASEFLDRAGTDARLWAQEWLRIYHTIDRRDVDEGWMIGWFANAFAAQEARDMRKDSQPFKAGYEAGRHDYHLEFVRGVGPTESLAKRLHQIDEVTTVATQPGNAYASDYMRGMANGLILAQSIINGKDPVYLEPRLDPRPPVTRIPPRLNAAMRRWLEAKRKIKLGDSSRELRQALEEFYSGNHEDYDYQLHGNSFSPEAIAQARLVVHKGRVIKDNAYTPSPDETVTGRFPMGPDLQTIELTSAPIVKDTSKLGKLEEAMREWYGEMAFHSHGTHGDGTPRMGKFETEELWRRIGDYLGLRK